MNDFSKIITQAKELEEKIKDSQEKIKNIQAIGISGNNSVKITLNGDSEIVKVEISDEAHKEDKEILIDLIIYEDQMDSIIKKSINLEYEKDLNKVSIKKLIASQNNYNNQIKDRIAVVYATGTILYGEGSENIIGQNVFVNTFKKISNDDWIKAIVLRIDSPGGVALTSDIILRSLQLAKSKKPVIVSMGNIAASGGYYIASGADKIYADPLSITGSIGVFASLPNISGFAKNIGFF